MMEILKKAASPFVSFEEKSEKPETEKPIPQVKEQEKTPPRNEKFKNYFSDLMKKMDLPGPDYFEFAQMKEDLKDDVPREESRYRLAAKTLKISKPKLMESASVYLDGFLKDKESFSASISEKEAEVIGSKRDEIAALEKENKTIEDLILQKKKKMEENAEKISTMQIEISQSEEKIKSKQQGYLLAYNEIVTTITQDIEKIKTHIQ